MAEQGDLASRVQAIEYRYEIEEFILAYFGYGKTEAHGSYPDFFAEGAQLEMNGAHASKQEMAAFYRRVGASIPRLPGKYHMQITNFIIHVDGEEARVQFLWTQQINDTIKGPPRFTEQGREFDRLVRVDGRWRFKKRVVISDSGLIDFFDGTWSRRDGYSFENELA